MSQLVIRSFLQSAQGSLMAPFDTVLITNTVFGVSSHSQTINRRQLAGHSFSASGEMALVVICWQLLLRVALGLIVVDPELRMFFAMTAAILSMDCSEACLFQLLSGT